MNGVNVAEMKRLLYTLKEEVKVKEAKIRKLRTTLTEIADEYSRLATFNNKELVDERITSTTGNVSTFAKINSNVRVLDIYKSLSSRIESFESTVNSMKIAIEDMEVSIIRIEEEQQKLENSIYDMSYDGNDDSSSSLNTVENNGVNEVTNVEQSTSGVEVTSSNMFRTVENRESESSDNLQSSSTESSSSASTDVNESTSGYEVPSEGNQEVYTQVDQSTTSTTAATDPPTQPETDLTREYVDIPDTGIENKNKISPKLMALIGAGLVGLGTGVAMTTKKEDKDKEEQKKEAN